MDLGTWWLFVVMTFVVSATPGPNMLYVMSASARSGLRRAVWAMAGCMAALLAMMSLSAAGLGALLQSFPAVFDTLRLVGAAYLAYLGIKCWRAPVGGDSQASSETVSVTETLAMPPNRVFRQAFLVAASNPKAILFAAAFFPQFIDPAQGQWLQFAILLGTFSVIEVGWYFVYAMSGKRLSLFLHQPRILWLFNRITGGVFVGFAALMASSREA